MHVDKSIFIQESPKAVFDAVSNFHSWSIWSPWLVLDPEAKVNVREDGKFYEWEGKRIGSGEMSVVKEEGVERVDYQLTFLKPWKSKSSVSFVIKEEGDGVQLHWTMDGGLPFFLFWMKKMMEAFIGMDFDRGLVMLKDYVEVGETKATLSFNGMNSFEGCKYIGISAECSIDGLAEVMERDFTKLMTFIMDGRQENMNGHAFTIYHKWDVVNKKTKFTSCIPVHNLPDDVLEGVITGNVPSAKFHVVHQKGPYRYTGNVWAAQYTCLRSKEFQQNKSIAPMEFYLNSPKNTEENDLETEVWFAAK